MNKEARGEKILIYKLVFRVPRANLSFFERLRAVLLIVKNDVKWYWVIKKKKKN